MRRRRGFVSESESLACSVWLLRSCWLGQRLGFGKSGVESEASPFQQVPDAASSLSEYNGDLGAPRSFSLSRKACVLWSNLDSLDLIFFFKRVWF